MAAAQPASNPTNTIAAVLRDLGLKQRGDGRDFTIEGVYEGDRCVETYVVALTARAEEVIAQAANQIREATASTPFPFALTPMEGPDGKPVERLLCDVATPRKTMKPRTTPKRYETVRAGAPAAETLPEGKVTRSISIVGPVWAAAQNRAKEVDGLSVSHVVEQLLAAYGGGEFQFDDTGSLVPVRPTTDYVRKVLLEAVQDFTATATGGDVDPKAVAKALATTLTQAGYARPTK